MPTHQDIPGPRQSPARCAAPAVSHPRRRVRWVGLVAALAVALAGCQTTHDGLDRPGTGDPGTGETGDPGTSDPGDPGWGDDLAPDILVMQIDDSGGFVPRGYFFSTVPNLTVYGDGRAIVHGPQTDSYPSPALPDLRVEHLSEDDMEALAAAARDVGLLAEAPDYGMPGVTDMSTVTATLTVGGRTYEHSAYALGFVDGEDWMDGGQDDGEFPGGLGLTPAQVTTRATLVDFMRTAYELIGTVGNGEPYVAESLGVLAEPVDLDADQVASPETEVVPWPLDAPLADMTECSVIDGDAAQALLRALTVVTRETLFEQGGVTYSAWFRPLLPHESGCAGLGW